MNTSTTPHSLAPHHPTTAAPCGQGAVRLTDWGVIRAQGADAPKFLHGQLTQDFALLGLSESRLAAFCSPKGRMLASFVGFKLAHDDVLLACRRDLLTPTLKRLSMFVMRAQCRLSDATDHWDLWGLAGPRAQDWANALDLGPATWSKASLHAAGQNSDTVGSGAPGALVRLPAAGQGSDAVTRMLACVPAGQALPGDWSALTAEDWAALAVRSGVAMVSQAVADAFVPQMLNYESVGGVNFKKGCYPGQEVVARSQFRGTIKRRTYRVAATQALAVGQEVFHSSDAEQPCGTVVEVAPTPGGCEALVSMQTQAAEGGQLHAGSATGPELALQPLPYILLADV